jgi:arylsulfatase
VYGVQQAPVEGVSMVYAFNDPKAATRHPTQYFEMFGNRAIYHDGWVAATTPPVAPWIAVAPKPIDVLDDFQWELYNVAEDFSQSNNLAKTNPAKLQDLQRRFYIESVKYNVLPIDNSRVERLDVSNRPSLTRGRDTFTYYAGMVRIPEGSAPDIKNRSWGLKAEVEVADNAEGMLITQGGRFAGWGLYVNAGKPVFHYNLAGVERYAIEGEKLTPGKHAIEFAFKYDGGGAGRGGEATLIVDGKTVGTKKFPQTLGYRMSLDETLDVGEDTGTPVSEDYRVPFKFNGKIDRVTLKLVPQAEGRAVETKQ